MARYAEKKAMKYKYDDTDYSLENGLQYPPEMHCLHKDYPMALAITTINEDMLSNVHKILTNITTTRKQEMRKHNALNGFKDAQIVQPTDIANLVGVEKISKQ